MIRGFVNEAMDEQVRAWLHNDPELLARVNVEAVSDELLEEGVLPHSVNTNERYDLVRDTVEKHDAEADQ